MPNTRGLRVLFFLVLGQAVLIGRSIIWPETISETLPWPASPLNTRFVSALYLMGAVTSLLAMVARTYAEVRVSLVTVWIITGGLLLLTLPHLGEFTASTFPYRWIMFYTLDAVIVGVVLWRLRGRDPAPAGRNRVAPLLYEYAGVLAVAGAVMLVAPGFAVDVWPWNVSPILAQVYSVFFLTFAVGGFLCARDPRPEASRIYLAANAAMLVLILAVSIAYAERFRPGVATWVWYVVWGGGLLTLTVALGLTGLRGARPEPAAVRS